MSATVISTTMTSTGTDPDGWRQWWAVQSQTDGCDWRGGLDQHQDVLNRLRLAKGVVVSTFDDLCRKADKKRSAERKDPSTLRARRLLNDNVSIERAWAELNDPLNHWTPKVTIEAVVYSIRERGLAALKEPANVERLSRCNAAAKAEIEQRIAKLRKD
jgi:hypothetical protein